MDSSELLSKSLDLIAEGARGDTLFLSGSKFRKFPCYTVYFMDCISSWDWLAPIRVGHISAYNTEICLKLSC